MTNISDIEQKILKTIYSLGEKSSIDELVKESGIEKDAIFSAIEKLSNKKAVKVKIATRKKVKLTIKGIEAVANGLPERKIYNLIMKQKGKIKIEDLRKRMKNEDEKSVRSAIGWAVRKGWITIRKKAVIPSLKKAPPEGLDEKLLKKLAEDKEWKIIEGIDRELLEVLEMLRRRKLVEFDVDPKIRVFLTEKGEEMLKKKGEEITILTRDHLIKRAWENKKFKEYNVTAPPPRVYYGNRHFFSEFIDNVKELLVRLGFEEVYGPLIELEFWNFDMLFYPQDSPIRDNEKPLILKRSSLGEIIYKEKINVVKDAHERREMKSKEKLYSWSIEYAKRLILKTSTMPTLLRHVVSGSKAKNIVKIFCADRTFKAVKPDYKNYIESVDVSILYSHSDANIGNLIEMPRILFKEMGVVNYYIRPAYQPYTEPTLEIFVKHRKLDWVKCIKMGVLREEIASILKISNPTLVWSINMNKFAFAYFNLEDVRELFTKDIERLQGSIFEV